MLCKVHKEMTVAGITYKADSLVDIPQQVFDSMEFKLFRDVNSVEPFNPVDEQPIAQIGDIDGDGKLE
jgi:hypothetical protein